MRYVIAITTALSLTASCGQAEQSHAPAQSTQPTTLAGAGDGIIAVDSDNGKTFTVTSGGTFTIKMKSHSDGGYNWTLKNAGGLGQPAYKHDTSSCPTRVVGCSGYEVFTFKTKQVAQGSYAINLIEMRFGKEPGSKYTVTIQIK